jgi:hypothetical protein
MRIMAVLMIFTWAAVGYDMYDRHYGQHADRRDLLTVYLPEQTSDPAMVATAINHTPVVPLNVEQQKRSPAGT